MFKNNPITSILGYVIIGMTWIQQVLVDQTIPQNKDEWFTFVIKNVMGFVALFSKDFNKTNAPKPAIETHTSDTTSPEAVGLPVSKPS